jgi:3-isopropylmalate dehydrogenase
MAGWSPYAGNFERLGFYVTLRPIKMFPGILHAIHGEPRPVWTAQKVDFIVVREQTEGLYCGIGGMLQQGDCASLAIDNRVVTRAASARIIRFAFELARKRRGAPVDGKPRVTCIAKDNVLAGCRLFRSVFHEIAEEYPDVEQDVIRIDAFTQQVIRTPEIYDVCVTTNAFGDIVTDLASVMQGGMGMSCSASIGERSAMFEPVHGSAPKHAGKNKANPMAMMLAAGEMLRWLGERHDDERLRSAGLSIESAVRRVVAAGSPLTYDLVGVSHAATCSAVGDAVLAELRQLL